jgi:uncharacterized protein YcfJ
MTNLYLEKIAASMSEDMQEPWTILGQKEVMLRHGYDVPYNELGNVNAQTANTNLFRQLKHRGIGALIGAAAGGIMGGILQGSQGASIGVAGGAMAGAIGGIVHDSKYMKEDHAELIRRNIDSGAWDKYHIGEKQASFDNPYLEKIAANKMKQYMIDTGQIHSHQFYGPKGTKVNAPSNQSINAMYASTAPTSTYNAGGRTTTTKPGSKGILGIGKTPAVTTSVENTATRVTGDSLAGGVKSRMVPKTGVKGLLGKAVGLMKRNPLATGAVALGAGMLAGRSSKGSGDQYQYA